MIKCDHKSFQTPNKFGCSDGEVFDAYTQQCKSPNEVPECACHYECKENSRRVASHLMHIEPF